MQCLQCALLCLCAAVPAPWHCSALLHPSSGPEITENKPVLSLSMHIKSN